MPQESPLTYIAHGQIPFFRLPVAVPEVPPGAEELAQAARARVQQLLEKDAIQWLRKAR